MMRILIIDNYDSFTYNLVQYMGELGAEIDVKRNDEASVEALLASAPEGLVISPGPGVPENAGVSIEAVKRFGEAGIPVLGVCLGHQSIGEALGLQWGDCWYGKDENDTSRHLRIQRSRVGSSTGHTKSGRSREVAMSRRLRRLRGRLHSSWADQ